MSFSRSLAAANILHAITSEPALLLKSDVLQLGWISLSLRNLTRRTPSQTHWNKNYTSLWRWHLTPKGWSQVCKLTLIYRNEIWYQRISSWDVTKQLALPDLWPLKSLQTPISVLLQPDACSSEFPRVSSRIDHLSELSIFLSKAGMAWWWRPPRALTGAVWNGKRWPLGLNETWLFQPCWFLWRRGNLKMWFLTSPLKLIHTSSSFRQPTNISI